MNNADQYFQLQEKGWALMQHHLRDDVMRSVVQKKDNWLTQSQAVVGKHFHIDAGSYKDENVIPIELAKGIVRAFLRYDPEVFSLGRSVYDQVKLRSGNLNEVKYATLPYAIIHLPSDLSEKGPMHKDGYYYIRDFQTTWTPLNDCRHEAIAVVEHSHFTPSLLERKLHLRLRRRKTETVKPLIDRGAFLTWYGSTDHEGLLNTSAETTVAMVFRFTSSPIMLEATIDSEKLGPIATNGTEDITAFSTRMLEIFEEVSGRNKDLAALHDIEKLCGEVNKYVESWKMSSTDMHKAGSALTLLAQRLETKQRVPLFYLYAIALSSHMVYPVQQLTNYLLSETSASNAGRWMRWVLQKYPYRQHAHVLNERMSEWNRKHPHVYADTSGATQLLYWNETI